MKDLKLSDNFKLNEFLKSDTAKRNGYVEQYEPSQEIINNLTELVVNVIQPARNVLNGNIRVNSGYRCKRLNDNIGSNDSSFHYFGMAGDLEYWENDKEENKKLYDVLLEQGKFTELIWEYGDDNNPDWVHVAYSKDDKRHMIKRIK